MKTTIQKIKCVLALFAVVSTAYAQITLTQTDLPIIGMDAFEATDTLPTVVPGGTGAQTWNFTTIKSNKTDSFHFSNPSLLAGSSFFPTANLGFKGTLFPGVNGFFNSSTTGLKFLGLYNPAGGFPIIFTSPFKFISTPCTGNTTDSGTYGYTLQFPPNPPQTGVDSIRITYSENYTSVMDAWGNVTTQLGTFNTLRQKLEEQSVTQTDGYLTGIGWAPFSTVKDTVIHYRWRTNSFKFAVVEIDTKKDGTVIQARRTKSLPTNLGQITLTQSDFPVIDMDALEATDTVPTVIPGGTGVQTWDFTSIKYQKTDSFKFTNPATLAGASFFPTANIGFKGTLFPGVNGFFNSNATGLDFLGLYNPAGGFPIIFTSPFKFITAPSIGNTAYSGSYGYTLQFPPYPPQTGVDSIRITYVENYTSIMDAWGNVTTQLGTFNCLRQKLEEQSVTQTDGYLTGSGWAPFSTVKDTVIHYRWRNNNFRFAIVELDAKKNGTVIQARRTKSLPVITGVHEFNPLSTEVYIFPNPVANEVNVITDSQDASAISIYDAIGRNIYSVKISGSVTTINTSQFDNGTYFYHLSGIGNSVLKSGKFIIAK